MAYTFEEHLPFGRSGAVQRVPAGGSLTEGVPSDWFEAGSWQFRTSIQVLGLTPSLNQNDLANAFARSLGSAVPGSSVRSIGAAIGDPFYQHLPNHSEVAFLVMTMANVGVGVSAALTTSSAITAVGLTAGSATSWTLQSEAFLAALGIVLTTAVLAEGLEAVLTRLLGTDRVVSRWVTIQGTIDTTRGMTLVQLNQAIASAAEVISLRVPGSSHAPVALPAASVIMRTSADDACRGGANYARVIARACTRVARADPPRTALPPPGVATTARPAPPQVFTPVTEAPVPWSGQGPAPRPPPTPRPDAPQPSRLRRWATPALLTLTAVAVAGLGWSLLAPEKKPATEPDPR